MSVSKTGLLTLKIVSKNYSGKANPIVAVVQKEMLSLVWLK